LVLGRTGIGIIAGSIVGDESTAGIRSATIIGTRVAVDTLQGIRPDALSIFASVGFSALVVIVATPLDGGILASDGWMTGINGAGIVVIAIQGTARSANPICTSIANRAGIEICACPIGGEKLAANLRIAAIGGADIAVVAVQLPSAGALPQLTLLAHSTGIAIVTWGNIEGMNAPLERCAGIVGAEVIIVAGGSLGPLARALATFVRQRAEIAVVALGVIATVNASRFRVA